MIEKVAAAIHKGMGFIGPYGAGRFSKELCDRTACAVLIAMYEPTPEMWNARHGEGEPPIDRGPDAGSPLDDWQAMIGAALEPSE